MQGLPILRPLWYHNLTDWPSYARVDNHFLVGEALTVRAITEAGAQSLDTYLPPGIWFDYWNEHAEPRHGGKAFSVVPDHQHVPVFVRNGHVLFKKLRPRRSALTMESDPYTVVVYGDSARGRVYIDDGQSHDFQEGVFIYDELEFDGSSLRSRPATLPAFSGGTTGTSAESRRPPSSPPSAGLRVERLTLVGLSKRPSGARVVSGGGRDSKELQVEVESVAGGSLWTATVRDPAVHLGPPNAWSIDLIF